MNTPNRIVLATSLGIVASALLASTAFAQTVPSVAASVGVTATPTNTNASLGASASVTGSASTATHPRADRTASSTTKAASAARMQAADTQIDNRISTLNSLSARVGGMKFVSASEKTTLQAQIQTQLTDLTNFKATLASATSTAAVRAGTQTTIQSTRVYALIVPQTTILAATDRVQNIVSEMTTLSAKFQARLSATSTVATSATLQTSLTDLNAKISDANTQAKAAQAEVVNLIADQGNQITLEANITALKDARTKIQTATKDLTAARADIATILKGLNVSVSASAAVTQ